MEPQCKYNTPKVKSQGRKVLRWPTPALSDMMKSSKMSWTNEAQYQKMILDEYKSTFQPHTNKNLQKQKEKDNDNDNATMNSYCATTFWNC